MRSLLLSAALIAASAAGAAAQERPQAYTGAQIIPIAGPPIDDGVLVVHRGRIVAVGPAATTRVPGDAERHDARGKVIMPGLVDSHSHIGGGSGGDGSAPMQPDVRIFDAVNVLDTGIQKAQAGGVTTVNIMPGSGHVLSGQTIYVKLRDGKTIEDLVIRDADGGVAGGIKMANGTNPMRNPPFPGSRAKTAALAREMWVKAAEYREKVRAAKGDASKLPPRDLGLEAMGEALDGRRVVHHHTHRHDDIMTVLRLAKEFGFRVVLHHVSEGWKVAGEIAKSGAPCSVIVIDSPGGKLEAVDMTFVTAPTLDKAGVLVGFHTDDGITDSRLFLRSAALAVRAGMPRDKALYGMTMANARILDLDRRVGSLEPGKDADFIVLSGDPLSVYTHVLQTFVDGRKVFDLDDPQDRLYAVGGYGASRGQDVHVDACMGGDE
jgi:imidazolonepropionase-like amidohydrolase